MERQLKMNLKKVVVISIFFSFYFLSRVFCQTNEEKIKWLSDYVSPINSINPNDINFTDLKCLKKAVNNKSIIFLGEDRHTDGSTRKAKTRLIKFLHEECGYNVYLD